MLEKKHNISIIDNRHSPWMRWLRSIVLIGALMVPGVLLDSAAMQWLGFVIAIMAGLGFAISKNASAQKELTIEEARDYLDALSE